MILTRLTSLLLLMLLMSTVLGAWIDTNGIDDEEDWTDENVNTEEPLNLNNDLNSPRQHKIPIMTKITGFLPSLRKIPWQARLGVALDDGTIRHQCGAIVIDNYWLLTAAHCLEKIPYSRFRIFVGDMSLSQREKGEQMFLLDYVISHEKYNLTRKYDKDIALLKIRPTYNGQGIEFSKSVKPIKLPNSTTYVNDGKTCLISGWGYFRYGLPSNPDYLQAADVQIVSHQICELFYPNTLTDNMICAGDMNRAIGICFGDDGGPLVCKIGDVDILIGISSFWFDEKCGRGRAPGVFTSVPALRNWITSKIGL